jgi:hypothetical protein
MSNRRQTTSESNNTISWVGAEQYANRQTGANSVVDVGLNILQKKISVPATTKRDVSIHYNPSVEKARRENLIANGRAPRATSTSNDVE